MVASMFDAVVQHAITPQGLPRMRTNGGFRNGYGTIHHLPVICSTHETTAMEQDSGVCIFSKYCGGQDLNL